jgi:hypothetical protein
VILVGNRGAKERHNAVALHLVHGAFIAVYCIYHGLQGGIQELLSDFRIKTADEIQRVFDMRKEYRDVLALAFQGRARHADLLGQGPGSIRQWHPLRHSVQRARFGKGTRRSQQARGQRPGESHSQGVRRLSGR